MKENSNFFERILQIIDYYGIKSVNSFAIDYLGYPASEKISRLKKINTKPSYDIIVDITNKFEEVDANWLLTGKGQMLKSKRSINQSISGSNNDNSTLAGGNISERTECYGIYNNNNNGNSDKIVSILKDQLDKKDTVITKLIDQQNDLIAQIRELNKRQK